MSQDTVTAMLVFDTEQSAQAVVIIARNASGETVTAGDIEVGGVMAHA